MIDKPAGSVQAPVVAAWYVNQDADNQGTHVIQAVS